MSDDFLEEAYYELRWRGLSKEEILNELGGDKGLDDVDRGILEAYEIFTSMAIAKRNKEESKKNLIIDCISSLEKDIQSSDQTLDLITKEIKKRKLENLSLDELLKFKIKMLNIKYKKMDALLKYKNLHLGM